ncbi:diguanylate cyclase/phosphodiesterase [Pacificibacter maritimus]|uniref:Diguanylate cyclase/phosphodiesterase n=1 Tax=Pacificibacter maritimus TaxID=762213 RepID=A0A3N4U4P9_9RHOB|nr:bifunctional diguanylate cyclase/phosphodiesterase [Pacificibacter maritimus]RPE63315.1 diguanylate cyclase/phosphodiesterase [Pacificibacter maritimus]
MRQNLSATLHFMQMLLSGHQALAFFPAVCLGAFWLGGEAALIEIAICLPILITAINGVSQKQSEQNFDGLTALPLRPAVIDAMDQILDAQVSTGRTTACLAIEVDDYRGIQSTFGAEAAESVLRACAHRITESLRDLDIVARLDGPRFCIALAPVRRADLETLIQMASRLQSALSEPLSIDATKIYVSASIGFCMPSRAPAHSGAAYLDSAEAALAEARRHGAGSIRAFSSATLQTTRDRSSLSIEVSEALENGDIIPWFQPQVSTDTGTVSGMEALARWNHPEHGIIPPDEFIYMIEESGLIERLGEIILYHAFTALQAWDKAGIDVPTVAVNFSATELANPALVDKIRWELDRFELAPSRLTVEILENVISYSENDTITRNITALSQLGCGIDLDDFGTGHASISNIRRFAVKRIKIDRSYVTRCDIDREQQDMLAAILTMAERINLETLTEGVETVGEHAMLAQLGCGHVQGFSIAHPMAFDLTMEWMENHRQKMAQTPQIGRKAS